MNNLFISYNINNKEVESETVDKAIEKLGNSTKIHSGFWYVNSEHSVDKAVKHVSHFLTDKDTLVIADTSNNESTWYNLEDSRAQRISQNWKM